MSELKSAIENAKENPFTSWRYFETLRSGDMTRSRFVASQNQFRYAVDYFSRPMAVLASRLPTAETRWPVIENVAEEHGMGDFSLSHASTFRKFLGSLDAESSDKTEDSQRPAVQTFNNALSGVAMFEPIGVGLGVFGIIEDLFSEISAFIAEQVVTHDWLAAADLAHYQTHRELDEKHSDDFYRLIIELNAVQDGAVGVDLGRYLFEQLYDNI